MSGDDLTIALFLVGTAISLAAAAMTAAGWKHPVVIYGLFGLAGLFFIAGLGWPFLKPISPSATAMVDQVAKNPLAWFVLLIFIVVILMLPRGTTTNNHAGRFSWVDAALYARVSERPMTEANVRELITDNVATIRNDIAELQNRAAGPRLTDIISEEEIQELKEWTATQKTQDLDKKVSELSTNVYRNNQKIIPLEQSYPVIWDSILGALELSLLFNSVPAPPTFTDHISQIDPETMAQEESAARQYYDSVARRLHRTKWSDEISDTARQAESQAESFVQAMPRDRRPQNVDPLDLRRYMIARIRCERIAEYIRTARTQAIDTHHNILSVLRQRQD